MTQTAAEGAVCHRDFAQLAFLDSLAPLSSYDTVTQLGLKPPGHRLHLTWLACSKLTSVGSVYLGVRVSHLLHTLLLVVPCQFAQL